MYRRANLPAAVIGRARAASRPGLQRMLLPGLVALLLSASTGWALEIREVRWGFDGKIVRNRFNIVSVLVDNPLETPFDGELWLYKQMSASSPIDAPLVEPVFVGPFAQRWVQFYPYVGNDWETFTLQERGKGGRRAPTVDLPSPRIGWPARVAIDSSTINVASRGLPIKRLPDLLFPPFVTATDSLQAVVIDSVPNWDEPRRTAFLQWLYQGGVVYVAQSATGTFPDFPAALGVLAGPLDESTYGAGRIYRVSRTRGELSADVLTDLFKVLPKRLVERSDGTTVEDAAVDVDQATPNIGENLYADASDPLSGTSFLSQLKRMTKPNHNWPLLHLLFWIYIVLVFPGCWLIGRRWSDYRVVYLALLATVAVFSVLFALVGQRGYGEATAVHSVAIVRPLPDGAADVSQWSNAFVTAGGDYEIRHGGSGAIYSTCNISELVKGEIQNGADANFLVDIPPFSSREFAHRVVVPLQVPDFQVSNLQVDRDRLRTLTLKGTGPLPAAGENWLLLHGDRFYSLNRNGDGLELGTALGDAVGYLRVGQYDSWEYRYGPGWGRDERPVIEQFREMVTALVSRSLNISRQADATALSLPPHIARVFYFAPMTAELFVKNPYLGRQEGWALYAIDVPLTSAPP